MRRGILLLVGVLAPLLAACAINPPRIVAVSPGREVTEVPANQPISITFDRQMKHESVESRFELTPRLSGCGDSKNCRFAWSGRTLMYVHAHVNFELSTRYTVWMHAGYADSSGQQNSLDHSWSFTVEGPPMLRSVDPSDNATSVALDRNVVLRFNRPMRPDAMRAAVQLSPETPFLLRTRPGGDTAQFEIVLTTLLRPNQSYSVSVDGAVDVHDNPIVGRVQTRFRTGPLSLSRRIGYLVGQRGQPAFAVGIVDPHPDAFLGRSTPKLIYSLSPEAQVADGLLAFDWSPDGRRLALVQAPRNALTGPIQLLDLFTGTTTSTGVSASTLSWSADGTIVYLVNGTLRRFNPTSFTDTGLTDAADGRVINPIALAPDGHSVAYSTSDGQGVNHLWILNLDLRTRYRPIGLDDPADHPAWSPNGTKLAFRRITGNGPQLWVYDLSASGSGAYRNGGPLDITGATWLNDNSTLIAATGSGGGILYRVNIFSAGEAGGVTRVTGSKEAPNGAAPTAPAYDRRVAFIGQLDGLPQIFVMNGDGSGPQQLTEWEADYPYTGFDPNWNPNG